MRSVSFDRAVRFSARTCRSSRKRLVVECGVKARWTIDVRYGHKQEALTLMREWVADVGSSLGLAVTNTQLSSGAVGVPESKIELEVAFDSLHKLEQFWEEIPYEKHRAWSERMERLIVHGSPTWTVLHTCPLKLESDNLVLEVEPATLPPRIDPKATRDEMADLLHDALGTNKDDSEETIVVEDVPTSEGGDSGEVVLDWKGDPMTINPGDKLPFKF